MIDDACAPSFLPNVGLHFGEDSRGRTESASPAATAARLRLHCGSENSQRRERVWRLFLERLCSALCLPATGLAHSSTAPRGPPRVRLRSLGACPLHADSFSERNMTAVDAYAEIQAVLTEARELAIRLDPLYEWDDLCEIIQNWCVVPR